MCNSFFNLAREPFGMSPDPHFFYPSAMHNEALAGLYYGIVSRKGFMVLSGEVGTGKTLVVRCLLDLLDRAHISFAYVFNTLLSRDEFLRYVASDLGIPNPPASKSQLVMRLSAHLITRYHQNLKTVLLVDEAQHLDVETLEEIRLLTNLETSRGKLLQIVLVGQPELETKLQSHQLRQLRQRVAMWFQLCTLSESQTKGYIERRMKQAGGINHQIFTSAAVHRIYEYAGGIPRTINVLCDNTLIAAFATGQRQITPALVEEVAADLHLKDGNNAYWPNTGENDERSVHVGAGIR